MKKRFMQLIANACFWIGDKFSLISYKYDNFIGHTSFDLYQMFMHWSGDIQNKYNLSGPWKNISDPLKSLPPDDYELSN